MVVTQDSSSRRINVRNTSNNPSPQPPAVSSVRKVSKPTPGSPKKMAVVKPTAVKKPESVKKASSSSSTPLSPRPESIPESKPRPKDRKISRTVSSVSVTRSSPKKSLSRLESTPSMIDPGDDEDVFSGLDASLSLMMHGVESDWIEEEMSDDDDFRKDVLEQKVRKALEEIGFSKKIHYKVTLKHESTNHGNNQIWSSFRTSSDGLTVPHTTEFLQWL